MARQKIQAYHSSANTIYSQVSIYISETFFIVNINVQSCFIEQKLIYTNMSNKSVGDVSADFVQITQIQAAVSESDWLLTK